MRFECLVISHYTHRGTRVEKRVCKTAAGLDRSKIKQFWENNSCRGQYSNFVRNAVHAGRELWRKLLLLSNRHIFETRVTRPQNPLFFFLLADQIGVYFVRFVIFVRGFYIDNISCKYRILSVGNVYRENRFRCGAVIIYTSQLGRLFGSKQRFSVVASTRSNRHGAIFSFGSAKMSKSIEYDPPSRPRFGPFIRFATPRWTFANRASHVTAQNFPQNNILSVDQSCRNSRAHRRRPGGLIPSDLPSRDVGNTDG